LQLHLVLPDHPNIRASTIHTPSYQPNKSQSYSFFLPSIISELGYKSTTAQLFTVPPNMCAFFAVLVSSYYSDKLKNRGYFVIGGAILGICGYIMLLAANTNAVRYAGTFFVAVGIFQGSPMMMVRISPLVSFDPANVFFTGMDIQQRWTPLRARRCSRRGHFDYELFVFHRNVHIFAARCA
jgi:predicted MFS family arabinose efflux permease